MMSKGDLDIYRDYVTVYFTADGRPTTRKTKLAEQWEILGNESFARSMKGTKASFWGVQAPNGKLRHVGTSRDNARQIRRETCPSGRVVALG